MRSSVLLVALRALRKHFRQKIARANTMMSTSTWERAPWADALRKSRTDYSVRVEEAGRGRSARSPLTIPARGWKDIFWRTYTQIGDDRPLAVGAGAVFYVLLALFPAITALVSLYGLLADPATINDHLSLLLQGVMPEGVIVKEQVTRLTQTSNGALGLGFFFGLALALWSANAGMKAIIDALNVVYDEREKRRFVTLTSGPIEPRAQSAWIPRVDAPAPLPFTKKKGGIGNIPACPLTGITQDDATGHRVDGRAGTRAAR
jgi:hypothetical protein